MDKQLEEIRTRVASQPGQATFDPAYMYKNTHADAIYLLGLADRYKAALELIAAPKRPDGTYNRCREACEKVAKEALGQ